MKKGQQVEGAVTRVDFPNKGIVQTDDGDPSQAVAEECA